MFSVVIPLYNKSRTVLGTVRSVMSQDFQDFELIIVDDGSSDDGPQKIAHEFDDPRIRIIHQENSGEGAARNAGIQAARYRFVAPLDADDTWLPYYLSEVAKAVSEFPDAGMICCGGVARNPDNSGYIRRSKRYGTGRREVDFFTAPFFFGNASSIVFSKQLAPMVGGFPVGMTQQADVVFFFRLALLAEVVFCPALISIYNIGQQEQASSDRRANIAATVESSNQIYEFWESLDANLKNPRCIGALVANLRSGLRLSLTDSDYELVDFFLKNTNPRLLEQFTDAERLLYPRQKMRKFALVLNRFFELQRRINSPYPKFADDVIAAM